MSHNYDRKDHYYQKAKDEGYRSRAAFKLIELNKKFKLFRKGGAVLDLGAWPGGWLQVAGKAVGRDGVAVGIDLVKLESFEDGNIVTFCGDVRDDQIMADAIKVAEHHFDVVLSDMSPKLSGIKELDAAATVGCAELAFYVSQKALKHGGTLVIKMFKNSDADQFVKQHRPYFTKVQRVELDSTRKTSNEFYFVGTGYKRKSEAVESSPE